jgi:hypothetical protein
VIVTSRPPSAIRRTFVGLVLLLACALSQADLGSTARAGRIAEPIATFTPVVPETRNFAVDSVDIVFSEAVTGVTIDDFTLTLDSGANLLTGTETITTSDNVTWTLHDLSGLTGSEGTYTITLVANGSGIINAGSEPLTVGHFNTWFMDTTGPSVTIDQAADQDDPVGFGVPVNFTVVFSEPINPSTFDTGDLDFSIGTVTPTTITITEVGPQDGTTFRVTMEGTSPGDLSVQVQPGALDMAGNQSPAVSSSTDNSVEILSCGQLVTVTSTADSGPGSLRDAIDNAACDGGTINFDIAGPGPHTISLASSLFVETELTILGPETESVILDGGGTTELMLVDSAAEVGMSNLTFANGYSGVEGAALLNFGFVSLTNMLFTGNTSEVAGGAITNEGFMDIANTTVSGNSTAGNGGGIFNCDSGLLFLLNVTITNNQAGNLGGGLYNITDVLLENSIIAGNTALNAGDNVYNDEDGETFDEGHSILDGDPLIGPLQDNGGPTLSHAPLAGSPAIDGGSNEPFSCVCLTGDQRGSAFERIRDGADADNTQTADIGAIEADPAVENIANQTTAEGVAIAVPFHVGDTSSAFEAVTATSSNTTLLPNGQVTITESPDGPLLTMTPAAGLSGTSTITVTVSKIIASTLVSMSDTFVLTVTPGASTPSITSTTTLEDTLTTSGLVISRNPGDGAEVTHFKITAVSGGTLFKSDGITPIAPLSFITFAEGTAGLRFLPAPNTFGLGRVSVQASLNASNAGLGGDPATAVVTISPVADTPSITSAYANFNQQTTNGLVIARNPVDGAEVTHFQVTAISGGTLFLEDGLTPIAVNGFVTAAQGTAGLAFTPTTGSTATGHVSVRAALFPHSSGAGGDTATADITVLQPIAFTDDPLVPGQTVIKVVHILELRARVNAQRVRFGLAEINLHAPVAGVTMITTQQLLQIRTALAEAYAAAGVLAPNFTDPGLPPGTFIKAVHIKELRAAIVTLEAM